MRSTKPSPVNHYLTLYDVTRSISLLGRPLVLYWEGKAVVVADIEEGVSVMWGKEG